MLNHGDVVLFSPASASFDLFKNFEERGKKFKEIVQKIWFGGPIYKRYIL